MAVKRISPDEARTLLEQGHVYLDVRSVPEYAQGHPAGARNVPLMHFTGGGMQPNPDFLAVVAAHFAKDARIVVGCKTGGRSQRAAMVLEGAGFTNLVEMRGGWDGERDPMGRVVEKGWSALGLPSEAVTPGGSFEELTAKKG